MTPSLPYPELLWRYRRNTCMSKFWYSRILEIVGQTVVGDGITCIIVPQRHMRLWVDAFPWRWWRTTVQWFIDRPGVTIVNGLLETALGLLLIVRASRGR